MISLPDLFQAVLLALVLGSFGVAVYYSLSRHLAWAWLIALVSGVLWLAMMLTAIRLPSAPRNILPYLLNVASLSTGVDDRQTEPRKVLANEILGPPKSAAISTNIATDF